MKKLNIYFNKKYLSDPKKCGSIFYPFIGPLTPNPNDPDFNRFDEYIANGRDYFNVSDNMAACDLAIWPESYSPNNDKIKEFLGEVEKYQKPAVFFLYNDSTEKVNIGKHFLFRPSLYRSARTSNEFAVPGVSEDFVKNYFNGNLPIRAKEARPVVGYCGYAAKFLWFLKLKRMFVPSDGWLIRSQAIKNISKSSEIIPNFIIRSDFWGGIYQKGTGIDYQEMKKVRREFVDNIVNSDYVICARGQGNFSYRLYETLSLGRIPVFINTDCFLPYEDYIKWREICVQVEVRDIKNIAQKVIDFHNSLSNDDFINLQKKCRETWEEWLSPAGFFKNFYKHFNFLK